MSHLLKICVLVSLLSPSVSWSQIQTETILKQNDLAPYLGVLVPELKYREQKTGLAVCLENEKYYPIDTSASPAPMAASSVPYYGIMFLLGVISGMVIHK